MCKAGCRFSVAGHSSDNRQLTTNNLLSVSSSAVPDLVISCTGLKKYYPDVKAVDGLDLSVVRNECFGLLGPNGAGKTTTIEILEGLTTPDGGDVQVLGMNWKRDERELREHIGISLQETQLTEKLTVYETLRLFRSFYRNGPDPDELLRDLSLDEKRNSRVGKLSGGQKQRLAVACALAGDPDILFLDEPTTGLDPQSRIQLWEVVSRFRAKGGTVLLTTHYMEEAERLCDRIAIVDHGRLIALGTPRELIAKLDAANVIEFTSDPPLPAEACSELPGCHGVTPKGAAWMLRVDSLAVTVPQLLATVERHGARLVTLSTHAATLEDVFVALTGRELRDA
jgi:ABC-2 type transport system ATP-binding protein